MENKPLPYDHSMRRPSLFQAIGRAIQDVYRHTYQLADLMQTDSYGVELIIKQSVNVNYGGRLSGKTKYTLAAITPSGRKLFETSNTSLELAYKEFYATQVEYHSKYESE